MSELRGTLEGFDSGDGVAIGWRMAFKHQLELGGEITLIAPNGPETPFGSAPADPQFSHRRAVQFRHVGI